MSFGLHLKTAVVVAALALCGPSEAREPAGSVCELPSPRKATDDGFGDFCGFIIETTVKPPGADPLACLRDHLARCAPAFAHSMFGFPDEMHEAVFVRRNRGGGCRVVVARNSLAALRSTQRELAYRTCTTLVTTMPVRLWDVAGGCGAVTTSETCPHVSLNFPCVPSPGDASALRCGTSEPTPKHQTVDASDILTTSNAPKLEDGYMKEWEAIRALSLPAESPPQ